MNRDPSRTIGVVTTSGGVLNGFGDAQRVRLSYTEFVSMTSTLGTASIYSMTGNDCFDPNFTGTGAQPINFDTYASQYNRYRVVGSECTITACGTDDDQFSLCLFPTNSTTTLSFYEATAQPYAKSFIGARSTAGAGAALSLYSHATSPKIMGRKGAQFFGSDLTQALVTASPGEVWLWTAVYVGALNETVTANVTFRIIYDVIFFDRVIRDLNGCKPGKMTRPEIKERNLRSGTITRSLKEPGDTGDVKEIPAAVKRVTEEDWTTIQHTRYEKNIGSGVERPHLMRAPPSRVQSLK